MNARSEQQVEIDRMVLKRVQDGLKWLEETHGPGWEDKIDMRSLNLASGEFCILGQVYAGKSGHSSGFGYASALMSEDELSDFGFDDYDANYGELQRAWEQVLNDRSQKDRQTVQ